MGASLQVASDSRLLWCSAPGLATQAFLANSMRANQEDLGHASEDQCRLTEQVRLATMRATAASESARAMEEALAGARREADTTREQLAALRQREADASAAQTRLQLAVDQAKSHITRCGCGRAVAAPGPLHEAAQYLPAAFQKSAPATQLTPAAASALSPPLRTRPASSSSWQTPTRRANRRRLRWRRPTPAPPRQRSGLRSRSANLPTGRP
jgi:hypothetical protein